MTSRLAVPSPQRRGRPSANEITCQLLIGEYPSADDIAWLREELGVTAVHSLQDDADLHLLGFNLEILAEHYQRQGLRFVRTPIPDRGGEHMAPHLPAALSELHKLISGRERVYLHCTKGFNRAPTLAIAYLHRFGEMPLDDALALVQSRRPVGPFVQLLRDYFR